MKKKITNIITNIIGFILLLGILPLVAYFQIGLEIIIAIAIIAICLIYYKNDPLKKAAIFFIKKHE